MQHTIPTSVLQSIPNLIDFPQERFWIDYDRDADVMYISFQRPQQATESKLTDDGDKGNELVGLTILEASSR